MERQSRKIMLKTNVIDAKKRIDDLILRFNGWMEGKERPTSLLLHFYTSDEYPLTMGEIAHFLNSLSDVLDECNIEWSSETEKTLNKQIMIDNLIRDEYLEFRSGRKKSEGYLQTILTFEKNLFGYTPSPQESINFWNSVIFYNYIQHSQYKPRSRRKTEAEEIDDYKEAFKEVLAEYQPDYIIIWSKFLFTRDWLPDGAPESPDYTLKAEYNGVIYDTPVRTFKLDAVDPIPAIIIQHPCCRWGKDQAKWHTLLKAFFETK